MGTHLQLIPPTRARVPQASQARPKRDRNGTETGPESTEKGPKRDRKGSAFHPFWTRFFTPAKPVTIPQPAVPQPFTLPAPSQPTPKTIFFPPSFGFLPRRGTRSVWVCGSYGLLPRRPRGASDARARVGPKSNSGGAWVAHILTRGDTVGWTQERSDGRRA